MKYAKIEIINYKRFLEFIKIKILYGCKQSIENEVLYKPITLTERLIGLMSENNKDNEIVLNDLHQQMKKYYTYVKDYTRATISKESRFSDLTKASIRISMYINALYGHKLTVKKQTQNNFSFQLNIYEYSKQPYCEEYIYHNIIEHEDSTYFYRVNDNIYKFFYFYKSNENDWFWSPPRKTDPEDIWVECPRYLVNKGYWKGMQIPKHIEEFVVWLYLLKPDIVRTVSK